MKKALMSAVLVLVLVLSFAVVPSAEGSEVSYGAEYTLLTPASDGYPDDGIKLTDGIYGTIPDGANNYYASGAYVGFHRDNVDENGNFVIIVDLGDSYDNLNSFTIGYLNDNAAGISAPKSVLFSVSGERNGEYTAVGTLETSQEYSDSANTFAKTLSAEPTEGRFVKVTITPDEYAEGETTQTATWTFIDEIAVHVGVTSGGDESSDTSNTSNESGATSDESTDISADDSSIDTESDTSIGSGADSNADLSQSTPQTGDYGMSVVGFVLLAVAAVSMAFALFFRKKNIV